MNERVQREADKMAANEAFMAFERFQKGQCSYDRALEDAGKVIAEYAMKRPIVGYIIGGSVRDVLREILFKSNKKVNAEKTYLFDCQIHRNEIDTMERMYRSLEVQ